MTIVQSTIRQYRLPLYQRLRAQLAESGIELSVLYGELVGTEAAKLDGVDLEWGVKLESRTLSVLEKRLEWQPALPYLKDADLVIVEQASKLLLNYVLFFQQWSGTRRLALWGHGKNFDIRRSNGLGEAIKSFVSRRVHWWFAYNDFSANIVRSLGYPTARITALQNTVDVDEMLRHKAAVGSEELHELRSQMGLVGRNVAVFSGGLYEGKGLPFLVETGDVIRRSLPDFELIVLGGGSETATLQHAAQSRPWLHVVGPKFGSDKARHFGLAKLTLIPFRVGLAIIDTFAFGVPLITTDDPGHGPEIDYLEHGVNGLCVQSDQARIFATEVVRTLRNDGLRARLVSGCSASAARYTMEEMVDRFSSGIIAALDADPQVATLFNRARHLT